MLIQHQMQVAYFRTVRVKNTILYYRGVINDNKNPLANLHLVPSMGYFKKSMITLYIRTQPYSNYKIGTEFYN